MTTTATAPSTSDHAPLRLRARWAWWGVAAGALGLAGNLISSHGNLEKATATTALADITRSSQHVGTLLGLASFVALVVATAGWSRWSQGQDGLVGRVVTGGLATTAVLSLFGTGIRGGLSEYLPGGINEDNFDADGLYVLFMIHDTAPWFAWWGVLVAAGAAAYLAFRTPVLPAWLGVVAALALGFPLVVLAASGAVAGAGLTGPLFLVVLSATVAVRGVGEAPRG